MICTKCAQSGCKSDAQDRTQLGAKVRTRCAHSIPPDPPIEMVPLIGTHHTAENAVQCAPDVFTHAKHRFSEICLDYMQGLPVDPSELQLVIDIINAKKGIAP